MKNYKKLQQLFDNVTSGSCIDYIGYNKHESSPIRINKVYTNEEIIISFNTSLGNEYIMLRCKKRENDYPIISFEDYDLNKRIKKPNCFYAISDDMFGAEVLGNECSFTKITIQTSTNIITILPDNKINGYGFIIEAEADVQGGIISNDGASKFNESESLLKLTNDLKKLVGSKILLLRNIFNDADCNAIEFVLHSQKNNLTKYSLTFDNSVGDNNFSYQLQEKKIYSRFGAIPQLDEEKNLSVSHFFDEQIVNIELYNFVLLGKYHPYGNESINIVIHTTNHILSISTMILKSKKQISKILISIFKNTADIKSPLAHLKKQLIELSNNEININDLSIIN